MKNQGINNLLKGIEKEINQLIYKEPKCDFEHIWNCAINEANNVVTSYQEDEYISLNEDKVETTVEFGKEENEKSR